MSLLHIGATARRRSIIAVLLLAGCSSSNPNVDSHDDGNPPSRPSGASSHNFDRPDEDGGQSTDGSTGFDSGVTTNDGGPGTGSGCARDQKTCDGACVDVADPAYGCGATSCAACDIPSAKAVCSSAAGDGACAIWKCTNVHADCDGVVANGCEKDVSSDMDNCGGCHVKCAVYDRDHDPLYDPLKDTFHAAKTLCIAGGCDHSACDPGYVDLDGDHVNGCETRSPAYVPEAKSGHLVAWLAQEDFVAATGVWPDRSGRHTNAVCASKSCPTIGEHTLVFQGNPQGFKLDDPSGVFDQAFTPTVFALARTGRHGSPAPGQLLSIGLTIGSFVSAPATAHAPLTQSLAVCSGSCLSAPASWGSLWQGDMFAIGASISAKGDANMWAYGPWNAAGPTKVDLQPPAARPMTIGAGFEGEISDIVVFDGPVSSESQDVIANYLAMRFDALLRNDPPSDAAAKPE